MGEHELLAVIHALELYLWRCYLDGAELTSYDWSQPNHLL